ncbi:MAG TPA: polysaccharide biosynthesis tyrosine autokinase [Syntrophales bacterium]
MTPNTPTTPTTSAQQQEVNLFEYMAVILRRRVTFALAFCTVFIGVILYTFLMNPIYEASSTLHVKDDKDKGALLGELSLNITNPINAELEILKSRTNSEQVVKWLHLDWKVTEKTEGLTFKILEFTSPAKKPFYRIELTAADTFKVEDDDGKLVGQGKGGILMRTEGFSLLLNDLKGQKGDSFHLSLLPFENAVEGLQSGIKAVEQGRQTSIIKVSYNSTSPTLARDIVNSLVQAYLEQSVTFKSEEAGRAVAFMEEQLQVLRGELESSEKELEAYKSSSGVIKLDSEAEALINKISDMEKARAEMEVQKRALLSEYTEAHPAVKALAKKQETVSRQLTVYEGKMHNLPKAERDLARLTRVSKVNADTYTFLLQKHEEARIAKASTISNINIVDPAIAPIRPIKPNKAQNLLLGLIIGLALGVGLAFFQEYLDDTIKNADEAKRVMGLPLLAVIPHIPGSEPKANVPREIKPITQREPKSFVSEAFRALRTSLHFSAISREKKIMLVTSTFPQEGKSIISSNLAIILSQTGARVLIVDCDLRRSSLHEKFGYSKTPGLSELLTGDVTFAETKHNTGVPGLDLISAGTTPPNPSELLGSEAMRLFLLTQRENYDHIVIDAPPVLAVSDAPVLTAITDVVVLVMEAGRVPIKVAEHMREILSPLHTPIAGLVMNDKTGKGESYGYYGGSYYRYGNAYGYGYGYYSDDESKPRKKITFWGKIPFLEKIVFWKRFLPSRKHRHR